MNHISQSTGSNTRTSNTLAQKFADYLRQAEYFESIKITGENTLSFKLVAATPAAKDLFIKNLRRSTKSRIHGTFANKEFLFHLNLEDAELPKIVDDFTLSIRTVNDYLNFWLIQDNFNLLYSTRVNENIYFGLHVN